MHIPSNKVSPEVFSESEEGEGGAVSRRGERIRENAEADGAWRCCTERPGEGQK